MGKGSKIKGLGSSWMKEHATNLLKYMPIVERATGKGPGKHGVHKSMAKYGEPKGQGPGEYGSMGPKLEMPPHMNKTKPEDKKKKNNKSHRDYEGSPSRPFRGSFFGLKLKGRA